MNDNLDKKKKKKWLAHEITFGAVAVAADILMTALTLQRKCILSFCQIVNKSLKSKLFVLALVKRRWMLVCLPFDV